MAVVPADIQRPELVRSGEPGPPGAAPVRQLAAAGPPVGVLAPPRAVAGPQAEVHAPLRAAVDLPVGRPRARAARVAPTNVSSRVFAVISVGEGCLSPPFREFQCSRIFQEPLHHPMVEAADDQICLSPLRGLSIFFWLCLLGLTPQANHLSPLRGSLRVCEMILWLLRAPEVFPIETRNAGDGAPEGR